MQTICNGCKFSSSTACRRKTGSRAENNKEMLSVGNYGKHSCSLRCACSRSHHAASSRVSLASSGGAAPSCVSSRAFTKHSWRNVHLQPMEARWWVTPSHSSCAGPSGTAEQDTDSLILLHCFLQGGGGLVPVVLNVSCLGPQPHRLQLPPCRLLLQRTRCPAGCLHVLPHSRQLTLPL